MERALQFTCKGQEKKYTKDVTSVMEEKAFEVAMVMCEKACEEVLEALESSFERTVRPLKKAREMKKNSATDLFAVYKRKSRPPLGTQAKEGSGYSKTSRKKGGAKRKEKKERRGSGSEGEAKARKGCQEKRRNEKVL